MKSNFRSKKKSTGGKYNDIRKKKKIYLVKNSIPVKIAKTKRKNIRTRGGNKKAKLLEENKINVIDPSTNKTSKTEIISVLENTANIHFVRMNILTKGAIVETKLGKAKITSRPSQDGIINAILLKNV